LLGTMLNAAPHGNLCKFDFMKYICVKFLQ